MTKCANKNIRSDSCGDGGCNSAAGNETNCDTVDLEMDGVSDDSNFSLSLHDYNGGDCEEAILNTISDSTDNTFEVDITARNNIGVKRSDQFGNEICEEVSDLPQRLNNLSIPNLEIDLSSIDDEADQGAYFIDNDPTITIEVSSKPNGTDLIRFYSGTVVMRRFSN